MVSLRKLMRSRFVPLIFLGGLLILGLRTCGSENAEVELVVDFGRGGPDVRELRIDIHRGAEVAPVAYHRANYGAGGARAALRWKLQLDAGSYTARLVIKTDSGLVNISRRLAVSDRAKLTISLEADLIP